MLRRSTLLLTCAVLTACGRASPPDHGAIGTYDVQLVRRSAESLEQSPLLTAELVFSVADEELTKVYDLAVDEAGNTYVADRLDACARVLDASGAFLRDIGGRGSGPGECTSVSTIALHGDSLFVLDQNNSIVVFDGTEYVRTIQGSFNTIQLLRHTVDGLTALTYDRPGPEARITTHIRPVDATNGHIGDPILTLWQQLYGPGPQWGALLGASPNAAITADGGALYTLADSFRIDAVSRDGMHRNVVTFDVPRIRTTSQQLKAAQQAIQDRLRRTLPPDAFKNTPKPRYRPAISRIVASPDGDILVRRLDVVDEDDPAHWVLLSADGTPRGHFELPRQFRVVAFRDCAVTGVELEAGTDVPVVQRYLIVKGEGDGEGQRPLGARADYRQTAPRRASDGDMHGCPR